MCHRLKMMMKVDEGLPKMFQRYNGKPTLMTASTRLAQVQQRPNATTCRLVFAPLALCALASMCFNVCSPALGNGRARGIWRRMRTCAFGATQRGQASTHSGAPHWPHRARTQAPLAGSSCPAQAQAARLPGSGFGLTSVRLRAGAPSQSCRSTAA